MATSDSGCTWTVSISDDDRNWVNLRGSISGGFASETPIEIDYNVTENEGITPRRAAVKVSLSDGESLVFGIYQASRFSVRALDAGAVRSDKSFYAMVSGQTRTTPKTQNGSLSFSCPSTGDLDAGETGFAFYVGCFAGGGVLPYTWSISQGALPAGLTLSNLPQNGSSAITGTPTVAGPYSYTLQVTDSGSPAQKFAQTYSGTITPGLTISCSNPDGPTFTATPYSNTCTASGGHPPYFSYVTALPDGLTSTYGSGVVTISGTPTATGLYGFGISMGDIDLTLNQNGPIKTYTGTITAPVGGPVGLFCMENIGPDIVNSPYSWNCTASGGIAPYQWSIAAGALPQGVRFAANGSTATISGSSTIAGPFSYTVQVKDSSGGSAHQTVTGTMATLLIMTCTLAAGPTVVNVRYVTTCSLSGGVQPYHISSTTPPPGLLAIITATSVSVVGTPTSPGTYGFTVEAFDSGTDGVQQVEQGFSGTIGTTPPPLMLACGRNTGPPAVNVAYTDTCTVSGGIPPYTAHVDGTLPTGLTASAASTSVTISGAPSVPGSYSYSVRFVDSANTSMSQAFAGTILGSPQTITFGPLANHTFGDPPFNISATASSGLPVSFGAISPGVCAVQGSVVTLLGGGGCTISANQAGNGNYNAAPPVVQSFQVGRAAQTINFGPIANTSLGSPPILLGATATSGLPVGFTAGPSTVCTLTGLLLTIAGVGTCSVTANQGGSSSYNPAADVTQTFSISPGRQTQTITFGPLGDQVFGSAPFSILAASNSGLAVTLTSNTPGSCTVAGSVVSILAAGNCSITATQTGNATYSPATAVTQSFTIAKASQTISFAPLPGQVLGVAPFALTATASSGLAVAFNSNTPSVCTATAAVLTIANIGECSITASQAGNQNFSAATPVTQVITVVSPSAVAIFAVMNAASYSTGPLASSSYAVVYGANLSAQAGDVSSTVSVTDANGVHVATLIYVSAGQINFLLPSGLIAGDATLTVTTSAGASASSRITIASVTPGLFTADSSGMGAPAAQVITVATDQSQTWTLAAQCSSAPVVCSPTPIALTAGTQVYLVLYGTGIRGGHATSVTIGGAMATILYSGAQGGLGGLDQVNILIPSSLAGTGSVSLQLTVDGLAANVVTVSFASGG